MVKIIRGSHETKVTKGAYENIFKPLGYTLVKEEKPRTPAKADEPNKNREPAKADEFKGKGKKQED